MKISQLPQNKYLLNTHIADGYRLGIMSQSS